MKNSEWLILAAVVAYMLFSSNGPQYPGGMTQGEFNAWLNSRR